MKTISIFLNSMQNNDCFEQHHIIHVRKQVVVKITSDFHKLKLNISNILGHKPNIQTV